MYRLQLPLLGTDEKRQVSKPHFRAFYAIDAKAACSPIAATTPLAFGYTMMDKAQQMNEAGIEPIG